MNMIFIKKKFLNPVTFWGCADNSNKELTYPYKFLYIIIILTYRKIYFHLYIIISKEKFIMKNSNFSLSGFTTITCAKPG